MDEIGKRKDAVKLLREFHGKLCETRVLDPACGSGNFLYVSMELMKRLEGEVVSAMASFGDNVLPGITIDPHQFLGIEINPRAAALAELVLWIGFIQWHKRTRNEIAPPEPILKDYRNIECRDAVLTWDSIEPVVDDAGKPVTRWDGRTTKPHPVTGEEVPDEAARVQELRYINPRKAEWPETDYIVGNPPFIGNKRMRLALGDGYVNALRSIAASVSDSSDFVMYWWKKAGDLISGQYVERFGLITTNSISLPANRSAVDSVLVANSAVGIAHAIPDHPWVDEATGASVRVAMTVVSRNVSTGTVWVYANNRETSREPDTTKTGFIHSDLRVGVDVNSVCPLTANRDIAFTGMYPLGQGFIVEDEFAQNVAEKTPLESRFLKPFLIARDISQKSRNAKIIDFTEMTIEDARHAAPSLMNHLIAHVKPHRDNDKVAGHRERWWQFARTRPELRKSKAMMHRFVLVPRTSRHFVFAFYNNDVVPDSSVVAIATDRAEILGILSSTVHLVWAVRVGGRLGVGNDTRYQHNSTFDPFPFPVTDDASKKRIGDLAEQLDAHRKRQQEQHPTLTMTGMYNVLEKLRSGEKLTAKEQVIHEQGLVSVLKQIHDDLDAAVFDAYGWPHDLEDEEILQRLVDLNHERAEEESRGIIRWLRPEFQNPDGATQTAFADDKKVATTKKATTEIKKQPWPKTLPERMVAIQSALQRHTGPAASEEIAAYYTRANKADVAELLETLAIVGNVRQLEDGRFAVYK